jgi:hypothetical protein
MVPITADPLAEWGGAWVVVLVPVVARFMFPMYVANPLCGGKITFLNSFDSFPTLSAGRISKISSVKLVRIPYTRYHTQFMCRIID